MSDDFKKLVDQLASLSPEARDEVMGRVDGAVAAQIRDTLRKGFPKTTTFYFHRNKEDNYQKGEELGLEGRALDDFRYTGYEVEVTATVSIDGKVVATHFNGIALTKPVAF